jgi:hypothetical protein
VLLSAPWFPQAQKAAWLKQQGLLFLQKAQSGNAAAAAATSARQAATASNAPPAFQEMMASSVWTCLFGAHREWF